MQAVQPLPWLASMIGRIGCEHLAHSLLHRGGKILQIGELFARIVFVSTVVNSR
jgi:hypothetical protein